VIQFPGATAVLYAVLGIESLQALRAPTLEQLMHGANPMNRRLVILRDTLRKHRS
jgi:hypothetical protein